MLSDDHKKVGKLIADMGLEKFLEVCGEQCAQFGSECDSPDPSYKRRFQTQWEVIGEGLRGLARKARSFHMGSPFVR